MWVCMLMIAEMRVCLLCVCVCSQLFQLIGLKTTGQLAVSKETVTLTHFLDVADAVVSV